MSAEDMQNEENAAKTSFKFKDTELGKSKIMSLDDCTFRIKHEFDAPEKNPDASEAKDCFLHFDTQGFDATLEEDIGENARVEGSIIGPGANSAAGASGAGLSVVGSGAAVESGERLDGIRRPEPEG